jgi:hypothetical protein
MEVDRWSAWCYPTAATDRAIDIVDLITLLFALDDLAVHHPGVFSQVTAEYFTARPPSTCFGRALQEVLGRLRQKAYAKVTGRVLAGLRGHLEGALAETRCRPDGRFVALEEYVPLRREAIGGRFCAALAEYGLGIDLSPQMAADADLADAWIPVTDHWILVNDLFSLGKEVTDADTMNLVLVMMHHQGIGLQAAVSQVGADIRRVDAAHQVTRRQLAHRYRKHSAAADIGRYLDALDHLLAGNLRWSTETRRYHRLPTFAPSAGVPPTPSLTPSADMGERCT